MLSAIEIYNKPNFSYREETFAILAVNSWELLLKAYLLRTATYKIDILFVKENQMKKNGEKSTRKKNKLNRVGNPLTIGLFDTIKKLEEKGVKFSLTLKDSIESLVELRDNAIHFHNEKEISKELQEIGFACIKNYMNIIKKWNLEIELSNYNFYLMPLAYVDSQINSKSIITDEVNRYLDFVKCKVESNKNPNDEFTIAISIDIQFNKTNSFEGLPMQYDSNGVQIALSEEDIRNRFPLDHKSLVDKAKLRYSDFKQGKKFNDIMKVIKSKSVLSHIRQLDPNNPKSQKKPYYNTNVWQEFDKHYCKSDKA